MAVLVGKPAPDFTATAVLPDNQFKEITLSAYTRGKYAVIFFYPFDFTFVCPTELIAFDHRLEEFRKRKGYDIIPELHALFMDIGPRTPKIRMDYNDVMVSLTEEHFWKPVFDWHQERGMTSGCDHGGRGRDLRPVA